jgi:hypothetical protein
MLDPDPYPNPHLINADPQPCLMVIYLTWNVLEDLAASCDGETPEQGDAARHPGDLGIYSSRVRDSKL